MHPILHLTKEAGKHWYQNRASQAGAAISYYTIFSLVPLLALSVWIAGKILGHTRATQTLFHQITLVIGESSAQFLQEVLNQIHINGSGITIFVIILMLILGTLGALSQIQKSLNAIFNIETRSINWKHEIWSRIIGLSIIPALALLLMFSIALGILGTIIPESIVRILEITQLVSLSENLVPTITSILLFAYSFRYLSRRVIPWREAFLGAIITATLFFGGRILISTYITTFSDVALFGTMGTFIALLIWIYFSAQMFLFGASFIWAYSSRYGYLKQG
ncbi:MAG: YihY/virulence factor BrkB family protein [Candidatus Pacebacteria bacterium]|nr:YihY/virulence factor BrkB family protein [Candidatus Paceibacterota bacterium]